MERIAGIVTGEAAIGASLSGSASVGAAVAKAVSLPYAGEYEYTPTAQAQTIPVGGTTPSQDIVVNPIPSNYGLITYNGSTITVS